MATCKRCGRDTLLLKLATSGALISVDASRVQFGVVEVHDDGARFAKGDLFTPRFMPHRSTCPEIKKERDARAREKQRERDRKKNRQLKLFG